MQCPTCGRIMTDIRGIGASHPQWVCNHSDCLSHHQDRRCPECSERPVQVRVLAIGAFDFLCAQRHSWRN